MNKRVRIRSYRQAGRLTPKDQQGLRARAVTLPPGNAMAWHSTRSREELILALEGSMTLAIRRREKYTRSIKLRAGQCALIPMETWHSVINQTTRRTRYIYVTAPGKGET